MARSRTSFPYRSLGRVAVAVVGIGSVLALIAASVAPDHHTTGTVIITDVACGDPWSAPSSGTRAIPVSNRASTSAEVQIVAAGGTAVFGQIEQVAPRTRRSLTVTLPPGAFEWHCTLSTGVTLVSPPVTVGGARVTGVRGYRPVTLEDVTPAATTYRNAVVAGLQVLETDTDALLAAVDGGDLASARDGWLTAHLQYERLGAAYGTFGDLDGAINGRPDGLPQGRDDPDFTGFLRLEYGLWHDQPVAQLAPVTEKLDADVHALVSGFPPVLPDVNDVALRTHEILENTLQFVLTGAADQGSGTELATARANVDGTRLSLAALEPLLTDRDPKLLARADRGLDRLTTLLDSYRAPDGAWTPLDALTAPQRERLDATTGAVLETLAPIPPLLEVEQGELREHEDGGS
jgi:high-affinity iron transporter